MTKRLSTIEEVIFELGGVKAVADLTNKSNPSTVPMWKNRKTFPAKTYAVMKAALKARGADAPDSLWSMAS